jgi:hemoglobin-like flavoprotein
VTYVQALLWTLEQGLGKLWTPEVREAWSRTYATVQSVMEAALVSEGKKAASEDPGLRQMRLVQESWVLVEKDIDAHGVKFFMRIFEIAPGALQLFSFRGEANLSKSPALQAHASTVMRTVGQAVAGLSDVKSLIPVLQSLGAAHSKYGVQPEHFPIVGQVRRLGCACTVCLDVRERVCE